MQMRKGKQNSSKQKVSIPEFTLPPMPIGKEIEESGMFTLVADTRTNERNFQENFNGHHFKPGLITRFIESGNLFFATVNHLQGTKNKFYGMFTKSKIEEDEIIIQYTGDVIDTSADESVKSIDRDENIKRTAYLYNLYNDSGKIISSIDSQHRGSGAERINHSDSPNAAFVPSVDENENPVIYIKAIRQIKPGEQITVDYGVDYRFPEKKPNQSHHTWRTSVQEFDLLKTHYVAEEKISKEVIEAVHVLEQYGEDKSEKKEEPALYQFPNVMAGSEAKSTISVDSPIYKLHQVGKEYKALEGQFDLTPLMIACYLKDEKEIDRLLEAGADINRHNKHFLTPLHCAILGGASMSLLKKLLAKKPEPSLYVSNRLGESVIHYLMKTKNQEILKYLIRQKDLDILYFSKSLLGYAISVDNAEAVVLTLEQMDSSEVRKSLLNGRELTTAGEALKTFLQKNTEAKDDSSEAQVKEAIIAELKRKNILGAILLKLTGERPDSDAKEERKEGVRARVPTQKALDSLETMSKPVKAVKQKADDDSDDVEMEIETKRKYTKKPKKTNEEVKAKETPEVKSFRQGLKRKREDGAPLLPFVGRVELEKAFAQAMQSHDERSALELLSFRRSIAEFIQKFSSDARLAGSLRDVFIFSNMNSHLLNTHLFTAAGCVFSAEKGELISTNGRAHNAIVAELLEQGASSINEIISTKETLLHIAAKQNNVKLVEIILAKSPNVNAQDNYGATPLHLAAYYGHIEVVKVLYSKTDIQLRDKKNKSILDIAAIGGHPEIVDWILHKLITNLDAEGCARRIAVFEGAQMLAPENKKHLFVPYIQKYKESKLDNDAVMDPVVAKEEKKQELPDAVLAETNITQPDADIPMSFVRTIPISFFESKQSLPGLSKDLILMIQQSDSPYNHFRNVIDCIRDDDLALSILKWRNALLTSHFISPIINHAIANKLRECYDIKGISPHNKTSFLSRAICAGMRKTALYLIKEYRGDMQILNNQNSEGNTAFHYAVLTNQVEIVNALIAAGVDTTLKNNKGQVTSEKEQQDQADNQDQNQNQDQEPPLKRARH